MIDRTLDDNNILFDKSRLIGSAEVRQFLNNMSVPTFYRNIKLGIIPPARYMGRTPVWRFEDIRELYNKLPEESIYTKDRFKKKSSSRGKNHGHTKR
jgi:predicted DNA-binding transcriptional regulator AlpA